jgi:hypothetical protein
MALVSPGVEVSIIDESNYIPAATNSVPYILLATAQNKISGSGVGVAAGTLAANANKTYLITSQRDLANTFGVPFFYKTTAGTPINGYELNEYGLLAAYSCLGISNRAYVQRVDVDLSELTASLVRPTGNPDNGTWWLDTANTEWGIFEWNATTQAFTHKIPTVYTNADDLLYNKPLNSLGSIGDYGVVIYDITDSEAIGYVYKNTSNVWVEIGLDAWKRSWPTVQGTATPTSLTPAQTMVINGTAVAVPASTNNTVTGYAAAITAAAITGVTAANVDGKLTLYADSTASADGSSMDTGIINIEAGVGGTALLSDLGITATTYLAPAFQGSPNYTVPRWRTSDTTPEPSGSVWQKSNAVNLGTSIAMKRYDTVVGAFVQQAMPLYTSLTAAIYALDPSGGGRNIPANATCVWYNALSNPNGGYEASLFPFYRITDPLGTLVTGTVADPTFTNGNIFTLQASASGSATLSTAVNVVLQGTTPAQFCQAVSKANVPYVSASVNSDGQIVMRHSQGGNIVVEDTTGTPLADAGLLTATNVFEDSNDNSFIMSNWVLLSELNAGDAAPDSDPADGRYWYYSATNQVDIMINGNNGWVGYQNESSDVRGYNLTQTNATGPIIAASAPTTQTDVGKSPLVYGDLWVNTSDLENYPLISRWENVDGTDQWVTINNADQTTENGIVFADARWAPNGTTDPVMDPFPSIVSLLTSNYLDLDAPDYTLYPTGTLLFNTRRSGYNVKTYQSDYFNATSYPDDILPTVKSTWLTASGLKNDGSPYMGRLAQRQIVVQALKAGIDTNTQIREEQRVFNLIGCPQYPELMPNMIALNNERNNTAFIVGDTPMRLAPDGAEIITWATNNNGEGVISGDGFTNEVGLSTGNQYMGTFYPSCQTTDLSGSAVVMPPSHMMLRTIIRNDEVAFPWLAPAGTRRGVVDNADSIGYIQASTGEFVQIGNRQGLRDVLYEYNINPITFVPGVGITNFGNKTTTSVSSALDRINVSRLVSYIRARLQTLCNNFLFEPNDQITRNEISNTITSLMIDLVAKRGIYDYLVVCDLSNNTPARIDRNELWVDIAIEPVKAVEFIYIPVRIKNTGEIAAGAVATSQAI